MKILESTASIMLQEPGLIGAYKQISILLQEQDHGLNDQLKIKTLKELLESNKLNYNKIINIYERARENVGDEQAFKELREKQNSFLNNSYELEILKSLYSFLLLSHDNLNIDTGKFLSSYKNKTFNNNFYCFSCYFRTLYLQHNKIRYCSKRSFRKF